MPQLLYRALEQLRRRKQERNLLCAQTLCRAVRESGVERGRMRRQGVMMLADEHQMLLCLIALLLEPPRALMRLYKLNRPRLRQRKAFARSC